MGNGSRKTEGEGRTKDVWYQTYGQRVDVDDHEVQRHGQGHGGKQPEVAPWGHAQQGLVLRQARTFRRKTVQLACLCVIWKSGCTPL